jgi:uncharacterized membrane protein YkoI
MAANCPVGTDLPLLIYVSNLSGRLRHHAGVKNGRSIMVLRHGLAALALAAALLVAAPPVLQADETQRDAIRRAVERGEIRPLADILAAIRDKLPGEVVGVEVERKDGRWLYEFRIVDGKGRLFEVYVDARSATIERTKEK